MYEKVINEYLKKLDVRSSRIKRVIQSIKKFEKYLSSIGKTLDNSSPDDLDYFLKEYTIKYTSTYYIEDLKHYYALNKNKAMLDALEKVKYKYTPPVKLNKFQNIKTEYLEKLERMGIKTNNQLLYSCRTLDDRKKLSSKTSIPLDEINKLTKMSDLCRIFAVKSTRAQLYFEAGIDTVEKIAKLRLEKLRSIVVKYVEENNFPGVPTLPKEARFTVDFARKLNKIVEF